MAIKGYKWTPLKETTFKNNYSTELKNSKGDVLVSVWVRPTELEDFKKMNELRFFDKRYPQRKKWVATFGKAPFSLSRLAGGNQIMGDTKQEATNKAKAKAERFFKFIISEGGRLD